MQNARVIPPHDKQSTSDGRLDRDGSDFPRVRREVNWTNQDPSRFGIGVVNHIGAMVAYWDSNEICVFANDAYLEWYGKTSEEMVGISTRELLGPRYERNRPYITGALNGEKQVFERQIEIPEGGVRDAIATYTPHVVDGVVKGFSVHVADVTILRERENELKRVLKERDSALAEIRMLSGLLSICAHCKDIRDEGGYWQRVELYVSKRSEAKFTHGICPKCVEAHFGITLQGAADDA